PDVVDRLHAQPHQLVVRFAHPCGDREVTHHAAVTRLGLGSRTRRQREVNRVVPLDALTPHHLDVVDAEDVIDDFRLLAPRLAPLTILAGVFFLRLAREPSRILFRLLLSFAILLLELLARNGLAVFRDETFPTLLPGQPRIVLQHFHRLAGR